MGHFGAHYGQHYGWHYGGEVPASSPPGAATFAMWTEAVGRVSYEWRTDIRKAINGLEQRSSRLRKPRQRYEFTAILTDAQQQTLLAVLATNAHLATTFLLGLSYEALPVSSSTATTITVPTLALCDWAVAGQRILVVHRDGMTTASATIQSVSAPTLTVNTNTTAAAVEGAVVMPAVGVYLDPEQTLPRYRVRAGAWGIAARAERFRFGNAGNTGVGATITTHDSMPVWVAGIGVTDAASQRIASGVRLLDSGGSVGQMAAFGKADWLRPFELNSSRRSDWQYLKLFLDTIKGRRVPFLLPTGRPDLVSVGDASSGTLVVTSAAAYVTAWWPSLAHRRVMIVLSTGAVHYRTVTNAVDNGNGTHSLTLASSLAGAIDHVELLEQVRLDHDVVETEINWPMRSTRLVARVVQR